MDGIVSTRHIRYAKHRVGNPITPGGPAVFVEFQTHPDGVPVTVNTRQVTTVGPDPVSPERTLIRFSDGREVVVLGTKEEVVAKLGQSGEMRAFRPPR
jgi:hypothetical protein